MLYGGQIRTFLWPVQWDDVIVFPENCDKLCLDVAGHCSTLKSARGTAKGRRISSLYLTAVILPSTTINCDFTPCAVPSQTTTESPPNLSRSSTQASAKCSPRRWYTRRRPSGRKSEARFVRKKDSSPLPH